MNTPDTRMPLAASALLEELQDLAARHFGRKVVVVSTDRCGRFEAGWVRQSATATSGRLHSVGHRPGLGLAEKQRHYQRMATLIRNYAKHARADQERITRVEGWPDCIELTIT
jgi:hypothetical protein